MQHLKTCLTFSAASFGISLTHKTVWFSNHRIGWIPFPFSGLQLRFLVTPHTSGCCAAATGLRLFHCHRKWAQCTSLDLELTTRSVQGVKIWASPKIARTGSGMGAVNFVSVWDIHILVSCPNFLHSPVDVGAGRAHLVWHQTASITPK